MGCCGSGEQVVDESSALLQEEHSRIEYESSYQKLQIKPLCQCGAKLNAYELQCCYVNQNVSISTFNGDINCSQCGQCMSNPHEMVWHCLKQHEFSSDLCWDCGLIKASSANEEEKKNDHENVKMHKKDYFDKKYNIKKIDWNELYWIICDEAKSMLVNRIINENIDTSNLAQYNFSPKILKFIKEVAHQVKMTSIVHDACNDNNGWTIQTEGNDICISYRKEENSAFHSIKSNFLCKCSVLDFIATLNEFDLIGELVKLIKVDSKMLKEFTNSNKVVSMTINMLWPMLNREMIIHVGACDALDDLNEVVLWGSSPKNDYVEGVDIKSAEECNVVRVDVIRMDLVCRPIKFGLLNEKDETRVIMIFNVDFKSYAPTKMVNWVTRTFAYTMVKVIRERCENLKGTKHEKRIQTKAVYKTWRLSLLKWQSKKRKPNDKQKDAEETKNDIDNN